MMSITAIDLLYLGCPFEIAGSPSSLEPMFGDCSCAGPLAEKAGNEKCQSSLAWVDRLSLSGCMRSIIPGGIKA